MRNGLITQNHILYETDLPFSRFGFVTFEDKSTAEKMIKQHDGTDIDGFHISLRFAEDRNRDGGGGGGGGGGGWGGRTPDFGGRGRGGRGRGQSVVLYSVISRVLKSFNGQVNCHSVRGDR